VLSVSPGSIAFPAEDIFRLLLDSRSTIDAKAIYAANQSQVDVFRLGGVSSLNVLSESGDGLSYRCARCPALLIAFPTV
jgi:hypothetical protein